MGRISTKLLTAKQVESESRTGYHADGSNTGLYLQVTSRKGRITRSWIYRFTSPITKTRREIGLGSTSIRKLTDARSLAHEFRSQVLNGLDPKNERDDLKTQKSLANANKITFNEAAQQCIEMKSAEWKNTKHQQQWINTLETYVSPTLGKLAVNTISIDLVFRLLQPIWQSKTETAMRVRQRVEVILDWCKARGYREGDNPASLKGGLGDLLPKGKKIKRVKHHAAIPFTQTNNFVTDLRLLKGTAPLALEFLLLTAARTSEVTQAKWCEFDLDTKIWTVPAERMKAGSEHRIPLTSRALDILIIMKAAIQNEYVFSGQSITKNPHLSNGAFLSVMKRLPNFCAYTPHGLRSSFRDWGSECTNFSNETLELALAHTIKNKAESAYRRQDQLTKRIKLMQLWEKFIDTSAQPAKVINLKRVAE